MSSATMTADERKKALTLIYRHTHRDFKGNMNGQKTILMYRNGTTLVNLEDLTDAEIASELPSALKREEARLAAKSAK
jgi:hypothetical protein